MPHLNYVSGVVVHFRYINNDNELVSFKFPLKLLGLSRKELEAEAENMQKD